MTEIKTDDDPLGLVDLIISDILAASLKSPSNWKKGFNQITKPIDLGTRKSFYTRRSGPRGSLNPSWSHPAIDALASPNHPTIVIMEFDNGKDRARLKP